MKKLLIIAAISLMGMNAEAIPVYNCPGVISYHTTGSQIGPSSALFKFYSASHDYGVGNICTYTSKQFPNFALKIIFIGKGLLPLYHHDGSLWPKSNTIAMGGWPTSTLNPICGNQLSETTPINCPFYKSQEMKKKL